MPTGLGTRGRRARGQLGGWPRLLLEGLGITSTSLSSTPVASVTFVGQRRLPYGVSSLSTLAALATVVAPAVCDLAVVDAGVVRLLLKGLGFTSHTRHAPHVRRCVAVAVAGPNTWPLAIKIPITLPTLG